jgi:hypothetical protein
MPIYQFACNINGEIAELILPVSMADIREISCPIHAADFHLGGSVEYQHKAEKIWSAPALTSGLSTNTPTVIFRNPNNPSDIRVAVHKGQETPHGFVKEELKTTMERSRVEKELRTIQEAQNDFDTAKREFAVDYVRKERHADLNAKMNSLVKDSENPEQAKALLKAGMNRNNKKRVPKKKTEFHFAVNHSDRNNLDKG